MRSERRRFRAAGQAIAALWRGISIVEVDIDGVELEWPELRSRYRPPTEVLADVGIGLAGIAAVGAYRFGHSDSYGNICTWSFGPDELEDFAEVRALIEEFDPKDTHDLLRSNWFGALTFLSRPAVWRAVETVAEALCTGSLTEREAEDRSARALWGQLVTTVETSLFTMPSNSWLRSY